MNSIAEEGNSIEREKPETTKGYLQLILDQGYTLGYLADVLGIKKTTLIGISDGSRTSNVNQQKIIEFWNKMCADSIQYSDNEIVSLVSRDIEKDIIERNRNELAFINGELLYEKFDELPKKNHFCVLSMLQTMIFKQKIAIIEVLLDYRGIQKKEYKFNSREKGVIYLKMKFEFLLNKLKETNGVSGLGDRNKKLYTIKQRFLKEHLIAKFGLDQISNFLARTYPETFATKDIATNRVKTLLQLTAYTAQNPTNGEIEAFKKILEIYDDIRLMRTSSVPIEFEILYMNKRFNQAVNELRRLGVYYKTITAIVYEEDSIKNLDTIESKVYGLFPNIYYNKALTFDLNSMKKVIDLHYKLSNLELCTIPELEYYFRQRLLEERCNLKLVGLSVLENKLNIIIDKLNAKTNQKHLSCLIKLYYKILAQRLEELLPPNTLWTPDDAWLYEKENPILALVFQEIKAVHDAGQLKKIFDHLPEDIKNRGYESIAFEPKPETWGECQDIFKQTPTYKCPYVSCRHHLALDIKDEDVIINPYVLMCTGDFVPGAPTCSLHLAELHNGMTLEDTGYVFGISKQAVAQRISDAFNKHSRKLTPLS